MAATRAVTAAMKDPTFLKQKDERDKNPEEENAVA